MGATVTFESDSVERTIEIGRALGSLLTSGDVVLLCGDLGAGKTHFAKGVASALGVSGEITSPTFTILRQHADGVSPASGEPVSLAHWDIYRLDEPDQLYDVDYFEILESGCVSLVEWGDKFDEALVENYLRLDIELASDGRRTLRFEGAGPRGEELVRLLGAAEPQGAGDPQTTGDPHDDVEPQGAGDPQGAEEKRGFSEVSS